VQGGIIRSLQTTTLAELVEFSLRADPRSARAAGSSSGTPESAGAGSVVAA
jgi:hypothetical protein